MNAAIAINATTIGALTRTAAAYESCAADERMRPVRLLVTGGAGFIGSNLVRSWLRWNPRDEVVHLDALTYAGDARSLDDVPAPDGDRYRLRPRDISGCSIRSRSGRHRRPDALL